MRDAETFAGLVTLLLLGGIVLVLAWFLFSLVAW